MTVMHAVINKRDKFGSFGWTQPYYFSPNDFSISIQMLSEMCNNLDTEIETKFPEKLLQYLVAELNYGGKLTNNDDQNILNETVKTFINSKVFEQPSMNTDIKVPDHMKRAFSSTGYSEEIYDLTGIMEDPIRNQNTITGDRYFTVNENSKVRSYLMPGPLGSIR